MKNRINAKDFCKLLSPNTHGRKSDNDLALDAQKWGKILKVLKKVIGEQLAKDNSIHLPFGKFYLIENKKETTIFNGEEIPIKNKLQARCSCSEQFKEFVNAGKN